jgi:hypothetical protein
MTPVDGRLVLAAALSICRMEAGSDDRVRHRLAEEIGLNIRTCLEYDHGIHMVNHSDWLRLVALDEALALASARFDGEADR